MKAKTKFYGYRAPKTAEDKRLSRLKKVCGCRNNSRLFQFALGKLEEIFLPELVTDRNATVATVNGDKLGRDKK